MYVKRKDGFVLVARYPGRNKATTSHNHDLEYLDKIKTPSAVMRIAAEQVALGKTPSEAVVELKGQEIVRALEEAGGLHINNNRVRNAYKAYKQQTNNGTLALRAANANVDTAANANTSAPCPALDTTLPPSLRVVCQCSAVCFETPTARPLDLYHCHCLECRKQSGSAFGTSAIFPAQGLFPLSVELVEKLSCYTRPTKNGGTMDCYFCAQCGVRIFHRGRGLDGTEKPTVSIKGGCIEGLDWAPGKHIYTRSAVVPIPVGVEQWRASPESDTPQPTRAPLQQNPTKEQLILPDFPDHPFT
jgi:hypothetical protein